MAQVGTMARAYRFGRFVLEPARRSLCADGEPVPLGSRAFDILELLIERRDTVVSREDILQHVWRGTVVEGNTLAVQISALRRALGEPPVIATVAGRGYRFVGVLMDGTESAGASLAQVPPSFVAASPIPIARLSRRLPAVAIVLVALLAAGLFAGRNRLWPPHVAPRLSIVVLPFRNLGHDAEQDYLADAISDDLTTDLSHIPGSVVIARTSADSYKGRAVPTGEIGRALDVRYVLEGSLMAEGAKLHINAQLINAPSGAHLWANAFDVPRDKLGEARAQIVNHIGSALNVTLVDVESARSLHDRPNNPDATDLYLHARSILDGSYSLNSLKSAQALLERATDTDPDYVDGLAALGHVLLYKISDFDDPDEMTDHEKARLKIERAMSIAPRYAPVLAVKGELSLIDGRCEQAEADLHLALSLEPGNRSAKNDLARCARKLGHMAEMIDISTDLLHTDPTGPSAAARSHFIGMGKLFSGEPLQAIEWLNRAGAGTSKLGGSETDLSWQEWRQIYLIAAYQLSGQTSKARSLYKEYAASKPYRTVWQLASYDTHAQSRLATYSAYLNALHQAGMPFYVDEDSDYKIPAARPPQSGGDFAPTPLQISGADRVSTHDLQTIMKSPHAPIIVDLGHGAAVLPGAKWLWSSGRWLSKNSALDEMLAEQVHTDACLIVVMADGPLGWTSYNASLHVVATSRCHVLWYRGGEQAWSAAGLTWSDERSP